VVGTTELPGTLRPSLLTGTELQMSSLCSSVQEEWQF